jgi:hypothetical protein
VHIKIKRNKSNVYKTGLKNITVAVFLGERRKLKVAAQLANLMYLIPKETQSPVFSPQSRVVK